MIKKKRCLLLHPSYFYCPHMGSRSHLRHHFDSLKAAIQVDAFVEVIDLLRILGRPCNEEEIRTFLRGVINILGQMPKYDIVGISCYTSYNYLSTIRVAELIRQHWPDTTIVVGGYHPTAIPEDFIYDKTPFDFIVQGEGEEALMRIVLQDIQKCDVPQVIIGKQLDPDEWPDLSYENYPHNSEFVFLATSRGCYMKCNFCSQSAEVSSCWRALPSSRALDTVRRAYQNVKPQNIGFTDPCFGFNRKWAVEFLTGLESLNLPVIYWAECRVDGIHDDILDIMARLNFHIYFGVESLSHRTIRIMGKTTHPKSFIEKAMSTGEKCIQKDIPCQMGFIMNYPGETPESFRETTDNLDSLIGSFSRTSLEVAMQIFTLFPGNEIFRNRKEYENRHGFQVKEPYWWRKATPKLLDLSVKTIGSDQLLHRYGFSPYWWTKEWYSIEKEFAKKLSMRAYTFQDIGIIDRLEKTFPIKDTNRYRDLIMLLWNINKTFRAILIDWNIILGSLGQYSQIENFFRIARRVFLRKRWEFIKSTIDRLYDNSRPTDQMIDEIMADCQCIYKDLQSEIESNSDALAKTENVSRVSLRIDGEVFCF